MTLFDPRAFFGPCVIVCLISCGKGDRASTLFQEMDASETNLDFENKLDDSEDFNIIEYLYFYNGGGVATGDINNDGLTDIYFSSNQHSNKLYLNKGNFQFQDITETAHVGGSGNWSTGVTMADVNGDGLLDIFVCGVGTYKKFNGHNQLFVNNGDLTFTDRTDEYGLSFRGFSTQVAFFDYDMDGDLDMYLLNHAVHTTRSYGDVQLRHQADPLAGDKLYRNDLVPDGKAHFTEVTSRAGILSSRVGYGLGIALSDVNLDGYPDIYVANDFSENDYLYINQKDGTFRQLLEKAVGHSSRFSMGTDIADVNNDGLADVFTLDMLPKNEAVIKTTAGEDPYEIFQFKLNSGYHFQFAKNAFQLNRGIGPDGVPLFSDIASLSGVEATDWSWSTLLADFDNDGYKDIFVTNGIRGRPNDLDYINYINDDSVQHFATDRQFIDKMPVGQVKNVFYRNRGDLTFEDVSESWIGGRKSLSNGASYADLDNDGDLDLIVNNINEKAYLYRNYLQHDSTSYLAIKLFGDKPNTFGIGTKLFAWVDNRAIYYEVFPTRGWESSVDYRIILGLGKNPTADSLLVVWPDEAFQRITKVKANQTIELKRADASGKWQFEKSNPRDASSNFKRRQDIPFVHKENSFVALNVERLIPRAVSTEGPKLSVGDVNGDHLEDVFVGGAAGQPAAVFFQTSDGSFVHSVQPSIERDSSAEDVGSAFFDADGNGTLDLTVVSGGQELDGISINLLPRLYLNDGKGNFSRAHDNIPKIFLNASCVRPADIDSDGDMDLFIGGRVIAGQYGKDPLSYFLINDGKGVFTDVTGRLYPNAKGGPKPLGMVTDAQWMDVNGDNRIDLMVVGEWMPVTVLIQSDSMTFINMTSEYGLNQTNGWWNCIYAADFDGDGDMDLCVGNLGENSRLRPTKEQPVSLFINDLDNNGSLDQIMTYYNGGERYPFVSRDQLVKQVPSMKRKFLKYSDYGGVRLEDIFSPEELEESIQKNAYTFSSIYMENKGKDHFAISKLPVGAQMFPIFAFLSDDINFDGNPDILAVGNLYAVQPDLSRYDGGYGQILFGDGKGNWTEDLTLDSGFVVKGEGRDLKAVTLGTGERVILVSRNNASLECFQLARKK